MEGTGNVSVMTLHSRPSTTRAQLHGEIDMEWFKVSPLLMDLFSPLADLEDAQLLVPTRLTRENGTSTPHKADASRPDQLSKLSPHNPAIIPFFSAFRSSKRYLGTRE
jgi:hypothetical protein